MEVGKGRKRGNNYNSINIFLKKTMLILLKSNPYLLSLNSGLSNCGDSTAQPEKGNTAPTPEENSLHSQGILTPGLTLGPGTEETSASGSGKYWASTTRISLHKEQFINTVAFSSDSRFKVLARSPGGSPDVLLETWCGKLLLGKHTVDGDYHARNVLVSALRIKPCKRNRN